MKGEFIRGDGLVIPNNVTMAGRLMILGSAFGFVSATPYMALVQATPAMDLQTGDIIEPTIGVNGYARAELLKDSVHWPTLGTSGGHAYVESAVVTFAAAGGDFDQPIQRMALIAGASAGPTLDVLTLSQALEDPLVITPTTVLSLRQFRYRVYI